MNEDRIYRLALHLEGCVWVGEPCYDETRTDREAAAVLQRIGFNQGYFCFDCGSPANVLTHAVDFFDGPGHFDETRGYEAVLRRAKELLGLKKRHIKKLEGIGRASVTASPGIAAVVLRGLADTGRVEWSGGWRGQPLISRKNQFILRELADHIRPMQLASTDLSDWQGEYRDDVGRSIPMHRAFHMERYMFRDRIGIREHAIRVGLFPEIDPEHWHELNRPHCYDPQFRWPNCVTPGTAAAVLARLADTGKVDWAYASDPITFQPQARP